MGSVEARALTDRIKTGVDVIWDLIIQAYTERAWDALGYLSWDDYCTREFGAGRLRLPREERAEVVSSLREQGLSIRAIASATGIDRNTVRSDLRSEVGEIHPSDDGAAADALAEELIAAPAPIIGTDGKAYRSTRPSSPPLSPEELARREEDAMRAAADIAELSAWGKACDGLLAAVSYAASSRPPKDTDRYCTVDLFIERYKALGQHINNWKEDA